MNNTIKLLSFVGLAPFLILNILSLIDYIPQYTVNIYFTQYSAVLLSFFGGVHWYDAISNRGSQRQLYVAMLPTLIAWACLMQSGSPAIITLLAVCYVLLMFYDKQVLKLPKEWVVEYTTLRMVVTTLVVVSHIFMTLQS